LIVFADQFLIGSRANYNLRSERNCAKIAKFLEASSRQNMTENKCFPRRDVAGSKRGVALDIRQARDAVPLQAAMRR
jgi:hypothetical protein